jgi:carbamoyltransferase
MLMVSPVERSREHEVPAVVHMGTGRLQTVYREDNPLYYDLIRAFERKAGIPVVLNTSFNENEPIVCAPEEAVQCFTRTRMDALAIGPFLALKSEN